MRSVAERGSGFRPRTVWAAFEESATRLPDKRAVVLGDDSFTYADLRGRAQATGRGLLALGVAPGARVAVWLPNSIEWLATMLGVGMIGAVLVPVNLRYRQEEAEYILSQSGAEVLLLTDRLAGTDYGALVAAICPELATSTPETFKSASLPGLRQVISIADTGLSGVRPFSQLAQFAEMVDEHALSAALAAVDSESVGHIQYTSGTTARPKGAMLTYQSILRDSYEICQVMHIGEQDVIFSALPFFHVAGYISAALCALQMGGTIVTGSHFEPLTALQLIELHRCTIIRGVETMFVMMMAHPDFDRYDISSLRGGVCGSYTEQVLRDVYSRMAIKELTSVFGLSETSSASCMARVEDPLEVRLTTNGRPLPGVEMRISDPSSHEPVPAGERGEILIRGWNVMKGYFEKPAETAEALDADGWLHTGDLGFIDNDGNLHFIDRIKDVIKVGGENVSAAEVESFLYRHPKIEICQVVAGPDPRLAEVGVAYVKLKPGMEATSEEVIDFCRGKIASFKVPRYVFFTDSFPITGSGKIQKFVLREQARRDVADAQAGEFSLA
jgi:fatty-acyl-CoA synthase